ncbi:hypothetical protein [Trueperella pyogenes]
MAVLLPGDAADRVEVQFTRAGDDLSALADAIKAHGTDTAVSSARGGEVA